VSLHLAQLAEWRQMANKRAVTGARKRSDSKYGNIEAIGASTEVLWHILAHLGHLHNSVQQAADYFK
jgi:hypothetical protein